MKNNNSEIIKNLPLEDINKNNNNDKNNEEKKNKVVLFANVKDEKHIREWVAHHLLLGFYNIIIFDHNSQIPLNKTLAGFNNKMVKIVDVSKLQNPIKMPLMNYAASIAKSINADWMIYLDADEFLIINNKNMNVTQLLSKYKHADSLGINWLMFGSNNLKKDPDGLILENYTKSTLLLNNHVKTFVRPNEILKSNNPHFYIIKHKSRMYGINNKQLGKPYAKNDIAVPYSNVLAYIAHYSMQSEETYYNRKCRPTDDTGKMRHGADYDLTQIHNRFNNSENLYPKNTYAQRIKSFLSNYNYTF